MRSVLTAVALFASTLAVSAEVTSLNCVEDSPGHYTLSYDFTGDTRSVQIFASSDPTGKSGMQLVASTREKAITVSAGHPGERMYFFLHPDNGEQREVSLRRLPLTGTPNFRDLGGYRTTDGRYTRWGLMYRSGVLTYLTPADLTYLSHLGIRVVCDFRTQEENKESPERWVDDPSVDLVSLPIGTNSNNNVNQDLEQLLAGNPTPAQLREHLEQIYGKFVVDAAPKFASIFTQLENDHLPLLYHCTAGKDRTGVFSAILLRVLGVPMDTIVADYALTNQYFRSGTTQPLQSQKAMANTNSFLARLSPEQQKVLMAADPAYIRSAFVMIDQHYGSFDKFRRDALHLSDNDVSILKSKLLY
jgi:protein-tyrosine phosphatase